MVELLADHVVCREGETLSANQAAALRIFDVKMAAFRMRLIACWQSDGKPVPARRCNRHWPLKNLRVRMTNRPANRGLFLKHDTPLVLQAALWRGERASSQESHIR